MNANSRYTCTNGSEVQREFPQWGVVGSAYLRGDSVLQTRKPQWDRDTAQQSRKKIVWPFTPKAIAKFSPGWERSDTPGLKALLGNNNAESVGH
jgi:hypothetical protein